METAFGIDIHDGRNIPPIAVPTSEAARLIGVKHQTLANWRCRGEGPRYIKLTNTRVVYKISDLEAWLDARRVGGEVK